MNEDQKHDREFMDTFMLILGFLVAFTFCIFLLANFISNRTQGEFIKDNPYAAEQKKERLAPIAQVAVAEKIDPNAPVVEPVAAGPINAQTIYEGACAACHGAGVLGAPKFAVAEDWTPRVAKGMDTLYGSAINGLGAMAAKGGRADLSDEEVTAAVDYMVKNSQ